MTAQEIKRLKPMGAKLNGDIQVLLIGDLSENVESLAKELRLKTDKITGANPAALAKATDAYYATQGEYPKAYIIGSMEHMEFSMPAVN
ncbi:hypothetical protein [Paenibacillus sp. FSL K6-2859]|uniref:hypothetical protein n=1 Tax=Paenibacillus sp. FSL K6-2859 TaxID=2921482 RepID=UPI0030FB0B93